MAGMNSLKVLAVSLAAGLSLGGSSDIAAAASERVRAACTSDYLKFCSQYDPDGWQTVSCMKRNGKRLSRTCRKVVAQEGIPSARQR